MKIRFYHWWIYELYYYFWTPIFKANPKMLRGCVEYSKQWLEEHHETN